MEQEILKLLTEYGGATAVIVALIFLLRALGVFIGQVKNNSYGKRISKIENNDLYHLAERIDELDRRLRRVEEKIAVNETLIKEVQKAVNNKRSA